MPLDVSPSDTHPKSSSPNPPSGNEIKILTCLGCGQTGVSICARCSKKPGYKTALARAHPLQDRDPELYARLDQMCRVPLEESWQSWGMEGVDGLCMDIGAEAYY